MEIANAGEGVQVHQHTAVAFDADDFAIWVRATFGGLQAEAEAEQDAADEAHRIDDVEVVGLAVEGGHLATGGAAGKNHRLGGELGGDGLQGVDARSGHFVLHQWTVQDWNYQGGVITLTLALSHQGRGDLVFQVQEYYDGAAGHLGVVVGGFDDVGPLVEGDSVV